jgi:hypothetical protein
MRRHENWLRERLIEDGFNPDDPGTVRILVEVKKPQPERKDLGLADNRILSADGAGPVHQTIQL